MSHMHWNWVLGMDQLLLQGLERAERYPDGKWAKKDPPDGLQQATNVGEGQSRTCLTVAEQPFQHTDKSAFE